MADDGQDILAKVDALFGKRAGFASQHAVAEDDFPVLTDIVSEAAQIVPAPLADALSSPPPPVAAPQTTVATAVQLSEMDIDRLAAALEARLSELLIRQQLRIDVLVRQTVREELAARKNTL
ncbi:MAG: hypothetical protein COS39_09470 [Hydrogenophilales bacterium CG03_land_8_20_14_0_80_62_28]|nr:MAG: hypothetical protein COS39_09470 [Hydrogenophilales bacterium CG03_land_8_20_14_0_80_62_28]PIX01216.1 MAG: hypothetical protein COZ79_08150 [Hydrogenophilales bacterium CG_4_8_14_3_um_filter_62_83]PIY97457.1 MAG: hypothetical protein COY64_11135 [Hydrogenophilales bacterium CG_4_10_14_0_8_um_filter_62_70]